MSINPEQPEEVKPVPAKRGRRPKSAFTGTQVPQTAEEKKEKRKSASNAKRLSTKAKVIYDVAMESMYNPDCLEEETVIIKLDVHLNDNLIANDTSRDGNPMDGPFAYNGYDSMFSSDYTDYAVKNADHQARQASQSGQTLTDRPKTSTVHHTVSPTKEGHNGSMTPIRLLMDFDEKCKNREWPASTSVHCYWCCHRFKNVPIGIPLTYNEDICKFMVYGCFCSCECAAAFNLDSKESSDEIMTRHGFLNMLARELGHQHLVRPAPSRLVLNMFGGPMSIEEFRLRCHTSRLILVNFPPMMTVTQQVEEINQRELRSEYRYIPIDSDRVNKYKEKIKLKRTKPLVNFKNTLDHTMNLKFA